VNDDDSKSLAEAGTFGVEIAFTTDNMNKETFVKELSQFLMSIAKDVESRKGGLIGHVKAFARVDEGFIRFNIVDSELGIDIGDEIKSKHVTGGTIKVMAAVVGVDDHHVEEIIERRIEDLRKVMGIEVAEHEDHDHCHEDGE
jgi:uncharacterized protein YwlG (UPF0340 family)